MDGELLVNAARNAIESKLKIAEPQQLPNDDRLSEKTGLFVTLHTHPKHELRGCIGFIEPRYALRDAIVRAAECAAFDDPRFPPLSEEEVGFVVVEVSILGILEEICEETAEKKFDNITPFKDGLVLEVDGKCGLFLPQVWEQLSSKEEFLANLCMKAGIFDTSAWRRSDAKLYKFAVQIFEEEKPRGKVILRE